MTNKNKKFIKQLNKLDLLAPKEMRLAAEWNKDWQVLIATILSARTKDETTIKICEILFKKYKTSKLLGNARLADLKKIIKQVNYYKTKAKNIKKTAKLISLNGLPKKVDELICLPGVGRKTANVFLAEFYKQPTIGVDTHVAFISNYLSWTNNKDPKRIEEDLKEIFPKKYWRSINYILVRFGRCYNRNKQIEILEKIKK